MFLRTVFQNIVDSLTKSHPPTLYLSRWEMNTLFTYTSYNRVESISRWHIYYNSSRLVKRLPYLNPELKKLIVTDNRLFIKKGL